MRIRTPLRIKRIRPKVVNDASSNLNKLDYTDETIVPVWHQCNFQETDVPQQTLPEGTKQPSSIIFWTYDKDIMLDDMIDMSVPVNGISGKFIVNARVNKTDTRGQFSHVRVVAIRDEGR